MVWVGLDRGSVGVDSRLAWSCFVRNLQVLELHDTAAVFCIDLVPIQVLFDDFHSMLLQDLQKKILKTKKHFYYLI